MDTFDRAFLFCELCGMEKGVNVNVNWLRVELLCLCGHLSHDCVSLVGAAEVEVWRGARRAGGRSGESIQYL